jgi:hypothetical protein
MALSDAERKRRSRANKVAQGFCKACGTRKPTPPKVTCDTCIAKRYAAPTPLPALRRKVTAEEIRNVLQAAHESGHGDDVMALRYAINKVLG